MSRDRHERLTARFLEAVSLDAESRRAFLDRVRRDDPALCSELESWLHHDAEPPAFLGTGGGASPVGRDPIPGECIGPYRILRWIGEGGMGVVYLAEQRAPLHGEVAIKLIKPGFESERAQARFEAERRVLERMDHPHVARVLDAGVTADRRPYVVMEHVHGEPIIAFADRHRLDVDGRLRLFGLVCDAVHHAHQNAVLHRDVKPANVLVALVDGTPVPKVIDFGIAKVLAPDAQASSTLTEAGQLIGTPAYMSPEQAGSPLDGVDIRTDVYSLGCVLHELLVGRPPLDPEELRGLGPDDVRRRLSEEPPSPSARLTRMGPAARDVADRRSSDPRALARRLKRDLDWIVLKAIAKERSRRYASASELGADVRRHLRNEVVEARPPSTAYRIRKLAARHRTASAAVAVAVPLVLVFGVFMAVQAHRVAEERDRAEEVSEFLLRFYETPFRVTSRHGARDAKDVLRAGLEKIRTHLTGRPALQARLEHELGEAMRATGDPKGAREVLETAHARLAALLGAEHTVTLAVGHDLAKDYRDLQRWETAESLFHEVLGARRSVLGAAHPDTLRTLAELGILYKATGRNPEAALALEEARSGLIAASGPTLESAILTSFLGAVLLDLRRLDEARAMLEASLAQLDTGTPEKGNVLYNLACVHALKGEREAALQDLRAALIETRAIINVYADPNLEPLFRDPEFQEFAKRSRVWNAGVRGEIVKQAEFAEQRGRYDESEALYRFMIGCFPPDLQSELRRQLGELYLRHGRYDEANPLLESGLSLAIREFGPLSVWVAERQLVLAQAHLGRGDVDAARAALDAAERIWRQDHSMGMRGSLLYIAACQAALTGDRAAALRSLQGAVDAGLTGYWRVRDDLLLRSLRDTREYREVMEILRRRDEFPHGGFELAGDSGGASTRIDRGRSLDERRSAN